MRARLLALGAAVATVASAGVAVAARSASGGTGGAPRPGGAAATSSVAVARQDLVARAEVDGVLGYEGQVNVAGHLRGTVTAAAGPGTVVERGQPLYSVDNRPVSLLYGDLPAWRRMASGMADGPDVSQLESNLVALGHAGSGDLAVDERFTAATAAAVRRWQEATGVEETGAVELGEVVFLPGPLRVADVKAEKGAASAPGSPVMTGTTTTRVVQVDLDATRQSLAKVGDKVDVRLPDGRWTPGAVATVGTVAQTRGQGETARRVVAVSVTMDDPASTGTIDQAPVRVAFTSESRRGVLAVPVNALLALAEGGYGLRTVEGPGGGPGRIVAVTTGLFARGMVEVSGDGLQEGMWVQVPAS